MKISEFKNSIDWKIFGMIMFLVSFVILSNDIFNNLTEEFSFILIIAISLLISVYAELKIREAPKILTIKEIRIKKLKKINRWKFLKN